MTTGRSLPISLVAVIGCGAVAMLLATACSSDGELIGRYCEYGAVSAAQLTGCIDHVTFEDVDRLDTNAARYARGEIDVCLADAGPFCR